MGWVGLVAALAPFPELGAGLGLVAAVAAGAEGVGVVRVEDAVEDGAAADGVRELKGRGTAVRGQKLPGARSVLLPTTRVSGDRQGIWAHLDGELLAGGPPLPSKLARPGPVRAPSPPGRAGSQGWPSASLLHTHKHTHTLHPLGPPPRHPRPPHPVLRGQPAR